MTMYVESIRNFPYMRKVGIVDKSENERNDVRWKL